MVGPGYWCHRNIQSGLGVGVTIIYGRARMLEINRTVVVYLPTYISMHRTRVEFLVP